MTSVDQVVDPFALYSSAALLTLPCASTQCTCIAHARVHAMHIPTSRAGRRLDVTSRRLAPDPSLTNQQHRGQHLGQQTQVKQAHGEVKKGAAHLYFWKRTRAATPCGTSTSSGYCASSPSASRAARASACQIRSKIRSGCRSYQIGTDQITDQAGKCR